MEAGEAGDRKCKMSWVYSITKQKKKQRIKKPTTTKKLNKKEEIFGEEQKVNQRAESQRSLKDVSRATFG